ncbi:MAG: hypothetical protein AB7D28_04020 [Candidatus Berkiella sp.]
MYQLYLKQAVIFFLLLCIPLGGNWLFLLNTGELLSIDDMVKNQLSADDTCIVGLATRNQGYYYKRAMYKELTPKILILGSSRVMQFRKDFFQESMMTSGGAMNSINEGFSYIKDIFNIQIPEMVIIGLDYWWFNENVISPSIEIKPPLELSNKISVKKYILPFKWVWDGKISKKAYLNMINPLYILQPNFNDGIGVDGILNKNGFGSDGSYYYTKTVTGKERNPDEKFKVSLQNIETNGARFEYADRAHPLHLKNFIDLVAYIKNAGSKVILFIPPLSPTVAKKMSEFSEHYKFIEELRNKLSENGLEYFDFHDPYVLDTSDCEFIDGIHGGDVLYARILKHISNKSPEINDRINISFLEKVISDYPNLAMIPQDKMNLSETDFLKIGCNKN